MKTSLDHLPERKRHELDIIVQTIRKEFEPEMIILFGSHARGTWVEDEGVDEGGWRYTYTSDFDIYVLMAGSRGHAMSTFPLLQVDNVKAWLHLFSF